MHARSAATQGQSILELIGNTPLLAIRNIPQRAGLSVEKIRIFAKAEWFNPGGSVKDRAASRIVQEAEANGKLTPDKILLDATSGNTGIAYAWICAAKGYRVCLTLPKNASPERKRILQALGVELILTSPLDGSDGAIREAEARFAASPEKYYYANQYGNDANWRAHYEGTGPEILAQTEGTLTHFVAGLGTTGTFTGVGRRLRKVNPNIQLVSFQPDGPFHGLEGLKDLATALVPAIYDPTLADQNVTVATEVAHEMVLRLAREEGLLVGISAGAALAATLQLAEAVGEGTFVTVFPDSGDKYLSEQFWERR